MTATQTATGRPLLSVVVPVYRVEAHLRQCLDSILMETGPDIELVAVDDASPDGCPAILDAYAGAHPRFTVVHLPHNVGLGEARNVGLDRVAGEYVWFVDSDDWLPAGALPAVLAALRAERPDVLLLDHVRVFDADGRVETDPSSPLLRGVDGAGPLARRPHLLGVQHAAWNKVVRVGYLRELGLRFLPGWYEDVPFSHPLLIAAGAIGVLDRVCYCYRQRAARAITRTVSERHFDALSQYERLFGELGRLGPVAEPFLAHVFPMMVNHCLVIVGNDSRIPAYRRADFFHRVAALYRRYLPAGGYPLPGGVTGLKHRMVAADAYRAYAALRTTYHLLGGVRRVGPPRPGHRTDGRRAEPRRPAAIAGPRRPA